MIVLVVSDLHLGKGRFFTNGQLNILEDFDEDERFAEFLDFYSNGKYHSEEIHLVLNGDILNLIQTDYDGIFTHIQTEDVTLQALEGILSGHSVFFTAIKKFLSRPKKKLSYVIGNHDFGMVWPKAQARLIEEIGFPVDFTQSLNIHGIHIEHGHRFEPVNSVPKKKFFVDGPNGQKILNFPWGSLFCLYLMPLMKKDRPYIDKVRPLSVYIRWCLIHDFYFFLNLFSNVVSYLVRTRFFYHNTYNQNFKTSTRLLNDMAIYPKYEKKAKRIFSTRPDVRTVIMGHTHIAEWRKFPEGKLYFNTGTWNTIPSLDIGLHKNITHLTYVFVEVSTDKQVIQNAYLNVWQGRWKPYREEVSMTQSR